MNRGIFALFVRSMREENRRGMTYIVRFLLITLVLLVVAANHGAFQYGGGAPGLKVFQLVTQLNLTFIAIVGLGYFSSAITEEKEDGTLGLLRMTNLSPLSILLGKSTSRLIGFLLLLLTQLPFVTLAVALGGVGLNQILSCYLILGSFTFLLANLALVFSVMFRRVGAAVGATLTVLVVCFWGFWFLGVFFNEWFGTDLGFEKLGDLMWSINPIASLSEVFATGFNQRLVTQPVSNIAIGFALFLLSWLIFDIFNQGEGRGATPGAARKAPKGDASLTKSHSFTDKPRPGEGAITWREFYYQCGGVKRLWLSFILIMALAITFTLIGVSMTGDAPELVQIGATFVMLGLLSSGVRWALEMASVFKHERQNQTWSSLTLTPKSVSRIAYEKVAASFISILPGLLVAAFGFTLIIPEMSLDDEIVLGFLYTFSWILFGSHVVVLLSLFLRWGALPIGIVCCIALQVLFALVTVLGRMVSSMDEIVGMWVFLLLIGSGFLHAMIGKRLEAMATED